MERNRSVATLEIKGGHPGLDFANTVMSRDEPPIRDVLATYDDLLDWGFRVGLLDAAVVGRLRRLGARSPAAAAASLQRAKILRETIYRLFAAVSAGREAAALDLDLLSREAAIADAVRRLSRRRDAYIWQWPDDDIDTVVRRLAHAAAQLLTGPDIARVKECPGHNCAWLFLDTTRNGRRRWCSDRDCGTLARVARHRERKRSLSCDPA